MAVQSERDTQVFTGVMDADTEKRYIRPGNYLMLLNARSAITNGQNFGAVEDVEGNFLVTNPYLSSSGFNKVVGSFEDVTSNSIIFFVYNSEGYDGIYRYYPIKDSETLNTIEVIYRVEDPTIYDKFNRSPLNFSENNRVTGVNLLDNLLIFNDGNVQPKQIDIVRANETNKKRIYAFYINPKELERLESIGYTGNITFVINIADPLFVVTQYSFSYTFGSFNIADVVKDICNQINSLINIDFVALNKINYFLIEFKNTGKYTLTSYNTGTFQCRTLPYNFYNNNLPEHYFNRIQFPPFCRPASKFIPVGSPEGLNPAQAILSASSRFDFEQVIGLGQFLLSAGVGIGAENNDIYNQITLGGEFEYIDYPPFIASTFYAGLLSYMTPRVTGETVSVTLNYTVELRPTSVAKIQIYLAGIDASGVTYYATLANHVYVSGPQVALTFSTTISNINIPANQNFKRMIVLVEGARAYCTINSGFITFGSNINADVTNLPENKTNIFRGRYTLENYQNSVYGQATPVVLRSNGYLYQDEIEVNYRDKFLQNDDFASRIKNITMSFSNDNGLTWYDYETLEPWQFACEACVSIFDNTKIGKPVDPPAALIQFHAVPLSAKSQSFADDRIWDGGIVEGYDPIDVDFDVEYIYDQLPAPDVVSFQGLPISTEGYRIGHSGYIGIVYYDDFDRKSPVCIGKNSPIKFKGYDELYADGDLLTDFSYIPALRLTIKNEPPDWATKYRIVRTKDFSQTTFLTWMINAYATVDRDGNVTVVNPVYFRINLDNIPYYVEKAAIGAKISYTFQTGDRIKIITDGTGAKYSVISDLLIEGAESNAIYVKYDPLINIADGSIVEIYSKSQTVEIEESLFYECGECYEIKVGDFDGIKKKYHSGSSMFSQSDQQYLAGNISIPATIFTSHGGTYYRYRRLFALVDTPGFTQQDLLVWVGSNYADEYTISLFDGLTRPNTVSVLGRTERPPAFRFTNQYISGTQLNGLNENEPANEKQFSSNMGWIMKMQLVNNDVLKLIFSNSYQLSIYVKQGVIKQPQSDDTIISLSDEVAGNSHLIQRTLGTQNPESVYINDEGDVFGFDAQEGVVWRSSGNGLIQVSDYFQKKTFKQWSEQRKLLDVSKSNIPAVYDLYHDEYVLTATTLNPKEASPTTVTFGIIGAGKSYSYTIKIYVEETGEIFSGLVTVPGTTRPTDYIKSVFDSILGWVTQDNSDGTITASTMNVAYFNKTFVVEYTVLGDILGPELCRNNQFLYDNTVQGEPWFYDGFDIVTIGNTGAVCNNNPTIASVLYQTNLGLKVGDMVRVVTEVVMSSGVLTPLWGLYTSPIPQLTFGTPIIATGTYTEQLVYNDSFADSMGYFLDTGGSSDCRIVSVSFKKVYQQPSTTYKFKVVNGYAGPSTEVVPFDGRTIAFNKQKSGWTQYHSFVPECYGRLRDTIVSFLDGQLWVHSVQATPKNYYGTQYSRALTLVSGKGFPKVRQFKALSIIGIRPNSVPTLTIPPYEGVPTGMESELTTAHFMTAEGIQYAAIQKDKLTPGYPTTDDAWVNGRNMVGQVIEITIVNNEPVVSLIYSVDILYFYSENS